MTDLTTSPQDGPQSHARRFVERIDSLLRDNGAARRALATGLRPWNGEPQSGMHPFVAPWLPGGLHPQRERAFYTVAALMTTTSRTGIGTGASIGDALAHASRTVSATTTESSLRRLTTYTTAGPYTHLRGAVRLTGAGGAVLDWERLLRELDSWYFTGRRTCTQWQQDYYRTTQPRPTNTTNDSE
ncbi:type I-E CRISPR-associated protein Cse2/CasB [Kitasatospora sp. NPDC057015]|uniref:type I-E CRISPR-associated protein Cse2/CasB n=1 Tax=Kitasatospora sp. NPDC057015 TaxID=3346001 RepID=UPI003632C2D2